MSEKRSKVASKIEQRWNEMHAELEDYFKVHGHSDVPQRDLNYPTLGHWVSMQRSSRTGGLENLSPDQIRRLNKLDFRWERQSDTFERRWKEKFERLKRYKREHGDCLVPQHYDKDKSLGHWVTNQRMLYKRKLLRQDRFEELERIGFVWVVDRRYLWSEDRDNGYIESKFSEMHEKLVKFHREQGHSMVPNTFDEDGVQEPLGRWVRKQRVDYAQGTLPAKRKRLLDKLDFVWKIDAADSDHSLTQRRWEAKLIRLANFKEKRGHCNVPKHYQKDPELAQWIAHQRTAKKEGTLDPRREEQLNSIGFIWDACNMSRLKIDDDEDSLKDSLNSDTETEDDTIEKKEDSPIISSILRMESEKKAPEEESSRESDGSRPKYLSVGTKVRKFFDGYGWFNGKVISRDKAHYYLVRYEDGDEEEYNETELQEIVVTDETLHDDEAESDEKLSGAAVLENGGSGETESKGQVLEQQQPDRDAILASTDKLFASVHDTESVTVKDIIRSLKAEYGLKKLSKPLKKLVRERLTALVESNIEVAKRIPGKRKKEICRKRTRAKRKHPQELGDPKRSRRESAGLEAKKGDTGDATVVREAERNRYPVGTKVKKFFLGNGWYEGVVICNTAKYRVRYEDNDEEVYDVDDPEVDAIVEAARDDSDDDDDASPEGIHIADPDLDQLKVGSRVGVYWPREQKWYDATVARIRSSSRGRFFLLKYDDDDIEFIDLTKHSWRIA